MRKSFLIFISVVLFAAVCDAQAPDLDKLAASLKIAAPPVETLDQAAIQLHYFDSIAPTPDQELKMLDAYKALSAGFAANVHYKQGYNVFQKYLSLKEKILARKKANVINKLQTAYQEKDKADEDKVVSLQNEVSQLNLDADGFISKRSGFKNIFSIIIVTLSFIFAASLFRSGVRLKNLNEETKANQEKLAENHRLASLGYLADGIPSAIESNSESLRQSVAEALRLSDKKGIDKLHTALLGVGTAIQAEKNGQLR